MPVEKTKIQTVTPKINGISPKNIYVTSDSMQSTNGKEGSNFNTTNWNTEENTVNIEVANPVNNNKITWKKDCLDEYIITYIYDEEAYKTLEETVAQISLETTAEISVYNLETTKITKQDKKEGTLSEKVNEIIMFNVETSEKINKGYMYTKAAETNYNETITIDIANKDIANKITIEETANNFAAETQETKANTEYKTTKINKDTFKTMLGEEGTIKIYNQDNQQIAEINKNTEIEGNDYKINYDTKVTTIKIETSKPETIGKLKIQNEKAITTEEKYTKEQIKTFIALKTNITGTVENSQEETIITEEKESTTILEEPTTKAETTISNNTLSTIVENENVEIKTVLKSSDITCKLYNNPTITIQLPQYIESVNFNEAIKILFTDELEIETGTYNPETKIIEVKLKGEQTKYNDVSVAQGPTIVLNLNIKLNELTTSTTDEITTTITNQEETTQTTTELKYIAPIGMVTVNTISGYSNEEETATSVSGQESTGKIETNTNAKTAIVTLTLINNNNNVCKNIQILGRTPFEGNKSITTGEDLGSTFTTELVNQITAIEGIDNSNITVYYSSNENATKDLSDTTNGWTTAPTNLAGIKSYLIILNDYEMATGTLVTFEYKTQIPEGLRNDEKAYGTFVAYYDNVIEQEEQPQIENNVVPETKPEVENNIVTETQPEVENNVVLETQPEIENNVVPEEQPEMENNIAPE